ncbi:unnamed protein product [Spirodela intermedia]|uniref:RING-type domain-containing protein n=1 Tax=Spirodela intermedia TaxID=51605 RepID=A0A7I8LMG2_SPIIN|nr:unnamed protein product [Spirodela intermedia]
MNDQMLGTPRKRGREEEEEEEMVVSTSAFSEALVGNHPSAPRNSPSRAALPPSQPCFFFPGNLDSGLSAMVQRDLLELDRFVSSQMEGMRTEMERRRRRRWAGVVRAVEEGVQRMVQVKDEEIASAARRSSALEDRLRVLAVEGQMWKKLARSSAASVAGLRRDIELANQAAAAWDGGEAEDSISCCEGRHSEEEAAAAEFGAVRRCGACKRGEASRLVLPCRHLGLCGECDAGADSCPLCGGQKSATISVFL